MASTRILGSIFERSCLIARNVLFHRDIPPYLKRSVWLHTRTSANMNIQPNRRYKIAKDKKNKEIEETEENKETKKDNEVNWNNGLKGAIYITIVISSFIFTFKTIHRAKSKKIPHPLYLNTLIHCRKDSTIVDVLGEPIKIIPQKNRVAHTHSRHEENGWFYEKFTFDITGPKARALVEAEIKKGMYGRYEYTKLCVTVPKVGTFKVEPHLTHLKHDCWKHIHILNSS